MANGPARGGMCSPRCSRWLDHLRPKLLLGFTATPPDPGELGERWRPLVDALALLWHHPARPTCCS